MPADDTARPVLRHDRDGIAFLTLNRAERLNAITTPLLHRLREELERLAGDDAVRAVVLTGAGRGFCAGQDLADRDPRNWTAPPDLAEHQRSNYHPVIRAIAQMEKPVIAAVNGVAAGAGASLALACDIVLAARSAKFVLSFSKVGLSADAGVGQRLVRTIGATRARALLMTAEPLEAERAARWGLIWRTAEDEALMAEAEALARRLAAGPTVAYGLIKQAVQAAEALDFEAYLQAEADIQGRAGRTEDYREGVLSFLEKRPAVFGGR